MNAYGTGLVTGAGDGTRTHDPLLGKQMLYQLSYSRPGADSSTALTARDARPTSLEVPGNHGMQRAILHWVPIPQGRAGDNMALPLDWASSSAG